MAEATIAIFEGWFPGLLRPLARRDLLAMIDAPLRRALGLRRYPRALEIAADRVLRARAKVLRLLPQRPDSRPKKPYARSYPDDYALADIGPAWVDDHGRKTA